MEPFSWEDFYAPTGPGPDLDGGKAILPDDPATKQAALYLLGGLDRQGIWTSTSDTSWSLMALSEYFKGISFAGKASDLTVTQPDGAGQRLSLDPKSFRTLSLNPRPS